MDEILMSIYKEANEHLRATDIKRDQTIAFYLLIIGLFFGNIEKLNDYKLFIALVICGVGIVMSILLITYRKWHIIYVQSAIVLQYLALNKITPTEFAINNIWTKLVDVGYHKSAFSSSIVKSYKHISTESLTTITFVIITFIPFYLVNSAPWIIGCHLFYVILVCTILNWILKKELDQKFYSSWLLRLYIPECDKNN